MHRSLITKVELWAEFENITKLSYNFLTSRCSKLNYTQLTWTCA
jgi:hypothetical protein